MALHTPAFHPTRAPHLAGMAWTLVLAVAVVAVGALLLWSLSRPVTTAPQTNLPYSGAKALDYEFAVPATNVTKAAIISYPSGYTANYSPLVQGAKPVGYPSGYTANYSPLGAIVSIHSYPSGYTATYDPLHPTTIPVVTP